MNVSYKGIQGDLPPKLQEKLDTKFTKLSKLLEGRGEKSAHVVVTSERHLYRAEITVQFYDHQLVAIGSDGDLFNAMSGALAKLEKQAVKQRARWREKARRSEVPKSAVAEPAKAPVSRKSARASVAEANPGPRIFRPSHHERRKPITLEEALLQMEDGRDYLVYRDADKQSVSMLVRRRDGHFDLIES